MAQAGYLSRFLYSWIIFFIVWFLFTNSLDAQELLTGGVITLIVALLAGKFFSSQGVRLFSLRRLFFALRFLAVFLVALVKANIDVALRVISPRLNIKPGIVVIPTSLKTSLGRMILANAITLTPGTLTVDIVDDQLYIHWIAVTRTDPRQAFEEIAGSFEPLIKEFVEP